MGEINDPCGIVGISNFVTFLENTKEYRRDLKRVEYGDERDPEMRKFLMGISPLTNAHRITKPMLIAQGLNDPRVPSSESEQIVSAIRNNGSTVWYLLAQDEGHGFRKKSNQDYYTNGKPMQKPEVRERNEIKTIKEDSHLSDQGHTQRQQAANLATDSGKV